MTLVQNLARNTQMLTFGIQTLMWKGSLRLAALGLCGRVIILSVAMATVTGPLSASVRHGEPGMREHGPNATALQDARQRESAVQPAEDSPAELVRNCEAGDVPACVNLAGAFDKGAGVKVDKVRAAALYARACELGEPFSCTRAAGMYQDGGEVPTEPERARMLHELSVPLYEKACARENASACVNLARMYANGHGVERDGQRAIELRTRACSSDSASCFDLANAYYHGDGIPQDLERAAEFFDKACNRGNPAACFLLAGLTERDVGGRGGPKAAIGLYKRACASGFEPACREERRLRNGELERR